MGKNNNIKIGERVEVASRFINAAEKLLDVGCGEGYLADFVGDKIKKLYGVDISKTNIQKASKSGYIVFQLDLNKKNLPFPNNYFDYVTCLDVLEHVYDPVKLIYEMQRVLKKKGKLILAVPNIRFSDHLLKILIKGKFPKTSLEKTGYDGGHINYFTFNDLEKILGKASFKIIRKEGIINKKRRGIKGRILEFILGQSFMREFRSPGILMLSEKKV